MGKLGALREPMITERQYQRFMKERTKGRSVSAAAIRAGVHRHTAARYLELGHGPVTAAAMAPKRGRRRPDPLKPIWPLAEPFLAETPEMEAKALFEHLLDFAERFVRDDK